MTVPTSVKVTCLLETGKEYPVSDGYSAEDYIIDTMAYNLGCKLIKELPICIAASEELLFTGEPESYTYTTEAYVFTKKELDIFVSEVKRAVHFDIGAMKMLRACEGPVI